MHVVKAHMSPSLPVFCSKGPNRKIASEINANTGPNVVKEAPSMFHRPELGPRQAMRSFVLDEAGVTAIEYGLLAALIAVTIIGSLTLTGNSLSVLFNAWSAAVVAAL